MTELRGFSVCPGCCEVYTGTHRCHRDGGAIAAAGAGGTPVAVAGDTPLRKKRLRTPRLGSSSSLLRRPVVPGRLTFLRDHAAVVTLAALGLLFFALALGFSG